MKYVNIIFGNKVFGHLLKIKRHTGENRDIEKLKTQWKNNYAWWKWPLVSTIEIVENLSQFLQQSESHTLLFAK